MAKHVNYRKFYIKRAYIRGTTLKTKTGLVPKTKLILTFTRKLTNNILSNLIMLFCS